MKFYRGKLQEDVLDYSKRKNSNTECITVIDQRFAIAYVKKNGRTSIYGQNYPYNTIPRCFGLMDTQMLEDVGVAQVQKEYWYLDWNVFSWNDRYRDRL